MTTTPSYLYLVNQFLVAMPAITDDVFARSVIYVCEQSEEGAMGFVINKPTEITMFDLMREAKISTYDMRPEKHMVYWGGPMQEKRGFVLHAPLSVVNCDKKIQHIDSQNSKINEKNEESDNVASVFVSTERIGGHPNGTIDLTTSRDILEALASGSGPSRYMTIKGCTSWDNNQLTAEIADNSWMTVPANSDILFETPWFLRYDRTLALLGITPGMLQSYSGRA
jgi:putative transcriptional regulator